MYFPLALLVELVEVALEGRHLRLHPAEESLHRHFFHAATLMYLEARHRSLALGQS